MAEVYYKFISDGKMQLRLEIWQRFNPRFLSRFLAAELAEDWSKVLIQGFYVGSNPNRRVCHAKHLLQPFARTVSYYNSFFL